MSPLSTTAEKDAMAPESGLSNTREHFPRPLRIRTLVPGLVGAFLAIAMIPFAQFVDGTIGPFVESLPMDKYTAATRQFANPLVVVLIVAIIWRLDPRRRTSLIVLMVTLLLASGLNDGIKHITGRARPNWGMEMGSRERKWTADYVKEHPDAPMRAESRDQWIGLRGGRSFFDDRYSSFPSGHANAAFVLGSYLSALYPQARGIWYLVAVGCGVARIEDRRHYFTDILFGAATGWIIAQIVFSWVWPARLGKRFFQRESRAGIRD